MVDLQKSVTCVCMNMRRTARLVTQVYNHRIESIGIKATQHTALKICGFVGPATIGTLAEKMSTDRTTLSRNLKKLETQKLIKFQAGEDARSRVITLTDVGKQMVDDGDLLWNEVQDELTHRIGTKRWNALQKELLAINDIAKDML